MRKIDFVTGEYYHIYNRGVDKREIFVDDDDYWKFFDGLRDLNNYTYYEERLSVLGLSSHSCKEPSSLRFKELGSFLLAKERVVDIASYSLNPNHFHLVLKQLKDKGISNFMHKLGTSFTNHFNKKYGHSGHVFQGPFKAILIDSNEYFLWLVGYVNGNIEIHDLESAENYKWSSYKRLLKECKEPGSLQGVGQGKKGLLSALSGLEVILSQFRDEDEFRLFVRQVMQESQTKKGIEKYLLE